MENTATEQVQEVVQPQEQTTEQATTEATTPEAVVETNIQSESPTVEATASTEEIKPLNLPTQEQQQVLEYTPDKIVEKFKDNKEALFKAFGYNEKALKALDLMNEPNGLAEYARVMSVDYNKVPDDKLIEQSLREQYASMGLSEEELSSLVDDELKSRYKQDADQFSEREQQLGKIRMKVDAAKERKTLIDRQAQWKWENPTQVQAQETPEQIQAREAQAFEQRRQLITQDEAIKPILTTKQVKFGEYNHNLPNPQETIAILYDNNRWLSHVSKKDANGNVLVKNGEVVPDYNKLAKMAAYVQDMDGIEKGIFSQGEASAKKKVLDENENVVLEKSTASSSEPDDVFTALNQKLLQRR